MRDVNFIQQKSTVTGKDIPRLVSWLTLDPCKCKYEYFGTEWDPEQWPSWLHELTEKVIQLCDLEEPITPNSVNINYYKDGTQSTGWHADNEKLFQNKCGATTIISLSLGATRTFRYKKRHEKGKGKGMKLNKGDSQVMAGKFQQFYVHQVPYEECTEARINFTWRVITKHDDACQVCGTDLDLRKCRPAQA